jgi:hypothetical protein
MSRATLRSPEAEAATVGAARRWPRVIAIGFPRLAELQSTMLSAHGTNITHLRKGFLRHAFLCDVVYQVGGPMASGRLMATCRILRRPFVKHWVGSDVLDAGRPDVRRSANDPLITHWTVAPWLADELRRYGIEAEIMPLSAIVPADDLPLPAAPLTVVTYLPDEKIEFYGGAMVMALARRLPHVRFTVVRGTGQGVDRLDNVEFLGFRDDMASVYARSHVLLRMPSHDGLSHMIMEALNFGRYAIWNHPFEGSLFATNEDEVACILERLHNDLTAGNLRPNDAGRRHIALNYAGDVVAERIHRGLEAAIARASGRTSRAE